jgi:hypothetical protein
MKTAPRTNVSSIVGNPIIPSDVQKRGARRTRLAAAGIQLTWGYLTTPLTSTSKTGQLVRENMRQISLSVPLVLVVGWTSGSIYLDRIELVQPPVAFLLIHSLTYDELSCVSMLLTIVFFFDFLLHQSTDFEAGLRLGHVSAASPGRHGEKASYISLCGTLINIGLRGL